MTGCNLREALARAKALGLEIEHVRRTGEVRVKAPNRYVTINSRRKDAPRKLTHLLRAIERERGVSEC